VLHYDARSTDAVSPGSPLSIDVKCIDTGARAALTPTARALADILTATTTTGAPASTSASATAVAPPPSPLPVMYSVSSLDFGICPPAPPSLHGRVPPKWDISELSACLVADCRTGTGTGSGADAAADVKGDGGGVSVGVGTADRRVGTLFVTSRSDTLHTFAIYADPHPRPVGGSGDRAGRRLQFRALSVIDVTLGPFSSPPHLLAAPLLPWRLESRDGGVAGAMAVVLDNGFLATARNEKAPPRMLYRRSGKAVVHGIEALLGRVLLLESIGRAVTVRVSKVATGIYINTFAFDIGYDGEEILGLRVIDDVILVIRQSGWLTTVPLPSEWVA
jgi:hypothetical protein